MPYKTNCSLVTTAHFLSIGGCAEIGVKLGHRASIILVLERKILILLVRCHDFVIFARNCCSI